MLNKTPKLDLLFKIIDKNKEAVEKKHVAVLDIARIFSKEIKKILIEKKLIGNLKYTGAKFWEKEGQYKKVAFVDGGSKTTNSTPYDKTLIVQAGYYLTDPHNNQIKKDMSFSLVEDFFEKSEIFEDEEGFKFDELTRKMMTTARIIMEMATIISLIYKKEKINNIFLHGPLQSRAVYFAEGVLNDEMLLPPFKEEKVMEFLPFLNKKEKLSERQRSFVNIYRKCQEYIKESNFNVYGVIEKKSAAIYITDLLKESMEDKIISEDEYKKLLQTIFENKFTDNKIFDLILEPNQFLHSRLINKQKLQNDEYATYPEDILRFPKIYIGYIKFNKSDPVRMESFKKPEINDLEYLLHSGRLLPNYGYPVGLQIVDAFVRVPTAFSKIVNKRRFLYLQKALKEKDYKAVSFFAKSFLGYRERIFFKRPK